LEKLACLWLGRSGADCCVHHKIVRDGNRETVAVASVPLPEIDDQSDAHELPDVLTRPVT